MLNFFFDLIYKTQCIGCGRSINDGILCKSCAKTVYNLPSFAHSFINGYPVFSAFYYEGIIKTLIQNLKFNHKRICANYAAEYLFNYIKTIKDINFQNAIIVPILTHKKNKNIRGYDNVFETALRLSYLMDVKLNTKVLKRIKYTKPQYELNIRERRKNIQGAFKLDKNFKPDNLVILLDDIFTTGSTLEFATSLFKENEISNLVCLTLAKTKRKK